MLTTNRLFLIPATVTLARAELADRGEFARMLDAVVPDNWPPESAADALPLFLGWLEAAPDQIGWFGWYALGEILRQRVLIGGGGFLGPPQSQTIQVGYSVLTEYQGQGYATEMVGELIRWAFSHEDVTRVIAETEWANPASVRVLKKLGFEEMGGGIESEGMRFELLKSKFGQSK